MSVIELARLVHRMRRAQRDYLNPGTRTMSSAVASRDLEREVDDAVRKVLERPGLFDGMGE